jgi:hypothetical protein
MVRENRIKEVSFSGTLTGDGTTTVYDVPSLDPINGEILEVQYSFNRTGSIAITISGTGEEVFRRNLPSGAGVGVDNWQFGHPAVFTETTTGSIANAHHVPFVANGPLMLNIGSMASGTNLPVVMVRYR